MKCQKCGIENKDTAKFCFKCGSKMEIPATEDLSTRPLSFAVFLFSDIGGQIQIPAKQICTIGREDKAGGYKPDIDLAGIDKSKVTSRKHGYLKYMDGIYKLADTGSLNGTFINGAKLNANVEYNLNSEDEVIFGKLVCTFVQSN